MATDLPDHLIERLQAVPVRIARVLGAQPPSKLDSAPAEGEWSAAEILAHVRASDDILAYRAYMMLARDHPPLPTFDERRWVSIADYGRLDVHDSLRTFSFRRQELVTLLSGLPPEAWARTSEYEGRGPVTLLEVMVTLVEHEEAHCVQLEAAVK
jgi:hypothetical protein